MLRRFSPRRSCIAAGAYVGTQGPHALGGGRLRIVRLTATQRNLPQQSSPLGLMREGTLRRRARLFNRDPEELASAIVAIRTHAGRHAPAECAFV